MPAVLVELVPGIFLGLCFPRPLHLLDPCRKGLVRKLLRHDRTLPPCAPIAIQALSFCSSRSFSPPSQKEKVMRVNPSDGRCRDCNGPLDIIDARDDTLTVECANWK